jgi:hypothetical protein
MKILFCLMSVFFAILKISFDQYFYHRECFKCAKCDKQLTESDAYVTNETNKLLNW